MKPQFSVVSRIDFNACYCMAKRLGKKSPMMRAFRVLYLCAVGLYGGFGGLIVGVGMKTGHTSVGTLILFLLSAAVLIWIPFDGIFRARGFLMLRGYRIKRISKCRYDIYEDGIWDESLSDHMLPYDFARYRRFSEDKKRFYILRDNACYTFDKRGFITGKADKFRVFMQEKMHEATLLYGDEDERNRSF